MSVASGRAIACFLNLCFFVFFFAPSSVVRSLTPPLTASHSSPFPTSFPSLPPPTLTHSLTHSQIRPMKFPINAATNVLFGGERFLHASVLHRFRHQAAPSLKLAARAKQFSSFILVVGTVLSADTFDPK